jgi:hypothetical protein
MIAMTLRLRLLHVGIACAYVLSLLGLDEHAVSCALACGYLLMAWWE